MDVDWGDALPISVPRGERPVATTPALISSLCSHCHRLNESTRECLLAISWSMFDRSNPTGFRSSLHEQRLEKCHQKLN